MSQVPFTSFAICHWLVVVFLVPYLPFPGDVLRKGHGFLGLHFCHVPIFILPFGSGEFWVSEPGQGQASLFRGLMGHQILVWSWSSCTCSELRIRAHDGKKENSPCDWWALVPLGELCVGTCHKKVGL